MTVYVDDMRAPFRHMVMCHMIADTSDELRTMARRIGLAEKWIQRENEPGEHFDVCLSKRAACIKAGAIPISYRELARMALNRSGPNDPLLRVTGDAQLELTLPVTD
jgi:hypothetical protein